MPWPPSDEELVAEYAPLVRKQSQRIHSQMELTSDIEDLVAYGFSGLVEARDRFDPARGVKFTTFAYYRIRGAILDGVRQMAYLPRRAHVARKAAEALDRAAEEVAVQRATTPDARDKAAETLRAMDQIIGRTCAAFVISAIAPNDAKSPEDDLIGAEERGRLRAAVDALPERPRTLIRGYYFEGRKLDELGKEMGISKSWASRICTKALGTIRRSLEDTS